MFNHNIVYTLSNKLVLLQCSNLGLEYFLKCFLLEIHCFPRCCTILSKMFCALPAMSPGRRSRGFIKIVAAAAQLEHSVGSSIKGSAMCQHAAMSGIVRGGHTRKCCKDRLPLPHVRPGIKLTPHHLCSQTAAATSQLSYLLPLRWIPPPARHVPSVRVRVRVRVMLPRAVLRPLQTAIPPRAARPLALVEAGPVQA